MKWEPAEKPKPLLVVHPAAAVSLDEAHLAIEQWEYYSGKQLDGSQRLAVELMMAEDARGRWAALTTARSMPRQNGKGDEFEVVEFYGITQRKEAILHTAHEIPTAKSAHLRMVALLDHRDFRARVDAKFGNGNFEVQLPDRPGGHVDRGDPGGIIVYRTRTAGGGRGLDDISRLIVDEAQHAKPEQLASSNPILAVNPNPQTNFAGTAGILGVSDWWWTMRRRALRGDAARFAYLEHSAELVELNRDGLVIATKPDPREEASWELANPALDSRIGRDFMLEELENLGPALFMREHLGVWDPEPGSAGGLIPEHVWRLVVDEDSTVARSLTYGLSVAVDGSAAAIGSSGVRPDGLRHVDCVHWQSGTDWVVDTCVDLFKRRRQPIRLNAAGGEMGFRQELQDRGVATEEVGGRDYQAACSAFYEFARNDGLRHIDQTTLNRAVAAAGRRDVGKDGAWVWAELSDVDISPLRAATLALSGVDARKRGPRVHSFRPKEVQPA